MFYPCLSIFATFYKFQTVLRDQKSWQEPLWLEHDIVYLSFFQGETVEQETVIFKDSSKKPKLMRTSCHSFCPKVNKRTWLSNAEKPLFYLTNLYYHNNFEKKNNLGTHTCVTVYQKSKSMWNTVRYLFLLYVTALDY